MKDLLTVVVPIYNVEKYLHRSLDSIVNQSYRDLEIILVDDGSRDSSLSICREYEKKDSRIRIIHKENGGVSSARNAGIDVSRGGYIAFLDPDDYIDLDMYSRMVQSLASNKSDICVCDISVLYESDSICEQTGTSIDNSEPETLNYGKELVKSGIIYPFLGLSNEPVEAGIFNSAFNKIFKAEIIKENNIRFREDLRIGEDSMFVLEYVRYVQKFTYYKKSLYNYCTREGSLVRSNNSDLFAVKCKRFLLFKSMLPEYCPDEESTAKTFYWHEIDCLKQYSNRLNHAQFKDAAKELWDSIYLKDAYKNYPALALDTKLLEARTKNNFNAYCRYCYSWSRLLRIKRKIPERLKRSVKKMLGRG